MKKITCLIALACFLCLSACASMPNRGDYVQGGPPPFADNPNLGTVYFLRGKSLIGGGMSYYVNEDNNQIGVLRAGTYFIHQTEPGRHIFWAETESRAAITLDIQPGQKYYIKGGVGVGMWAGRPELAEITEAEANQMLPDMKYIRLATPEETKAYKQEQQKKNTQ